MDVKAFPGFDQVDRPQQEKISTCIHCGLCLDKCPTYRTLGTEMDSPRGRVYLIKAVNEGRLGITPNFIEHMYLCLDCRACETACPSHVEFGDLMERARGQIERRAPRPLGGRLLRWLVFRGLFPRPRMLRGLFRMLRLYQAGGLQGLLRAAGVFRILPARLRDMEAMLPDLPPKPFTGACRISAREGAGHADRRVLCRLRHGRLFVDVHDAPRGFFRPTLRHPHGARAGMLRCPAHARRRPRAGQGAGATQYRRVRAAGPRRRRQQRRWLWRAAEELRRVACGRSPIRRTRPSLQRTRAGRIRMPGAGAIARAAGRRAQARGVRRSLPSHTTPRAFGNSPATCCSRSPGWSWPMSPTPTSAAAPPASTTLPTRTCRAAFSNARWSTSPRPRQTSSPPATPVA